MSLMSRKIKIRSASQTLFTKEEIKSLLRVSIITGALLIIRQANYVVVFLSAEGRIVANCRDANPERDNHAAGENPSALYNIKVQPSPIPVNLVNPVDLLLSERLDLIFRTWRGWSLQ